MFYWHSVSHHVILDIVCVCMHFVTRSCLSGLYLWTVTQLLYPWNFPGKNTYGIGCHFLLQGIFLTQGSKPHFFHLLHWQADSLPMGHLGSPSTLILPILRPTEEYLFVQGLRLLMKQWNPSILLYLVLILS